MKIDLQPRGNLVLVEQITEKTSDIIYFKERETRPLKGKVIAVGPGRKTVNGHIPNSVVPGEVVHFRKSETAGDDERKYIFVKDEDILCVEEAS